MPRNDYRFNLAPVNRQALGTALLISVLSPTDLWASDSIKSDSAEAPSRPTLFGREIHREGFHFHADLGIGGGPDTAGIYHAMEIGWNVNDYTISFLHSLIQNKNELWTDKDGPDEIGGFFAQVQGPIYFDDLVWKFAMGVGGTVDQPDEGGFYPNPGFGVHYGADLHFPIWPDFGVTLSLSAMNVVERGNHYFGAAGALGITFF